MKILNITIGFFVALPAFAAVITSDPCTTTTLLPTITVSQEGPERFVNEYTREYDEFYSGGLRTKTYTITQTCSSIRCHPPTDSVPPPGFTCAVVQCDECGGNSTQTATLTFPVESIHALESSGYIVQTAGGAASLPDSHSASPSISSSIDPVGNGPEGTAVIGRPNSEYHSGNGNKLEDGTSYGEDVESKAQQSAHPGSNEDIEVSNGTKSQAGFYNPVPQPKTTPDNESSPQASPFPANDAAPSPQHGHPHSEGDAHSPPSWKLSTSSLSSTNNTIAHGLEGTGDLRTQTADATFSSSQATPHTVGNEDPKSPGKEPGNSDPSEPYESPMVVNNGISFKADIVFALFAGAIGIWAFRVL